AMKDFSHPGTDKQLIDLNRSVESCLTVSRSEWKYVAEPAFSLSPDLPRVNVSPGEINQVCVNIIVNAAHAIADRYAGQTGLQGRISVSTRHEGDNVVIEIGDNGCGMPESVKEKIFNPFFTTKEVGRGTGQGLAIAYDIVVNRHGGALRVESEAGVGTRFLIELPVGQVEQATPFEDAA
ncbi:MAG: ATP-binding protein, partial [Pseudomonadota bacterium]